MKKITLALAFIALIFNVRANNVQVNNTTLTGQNTGVSPQYTYVKFDLSWDNSWRISNGPANWDAVWVFVKYQVFGGNWAHATISASAGDHSIGTNNGVAGTIQPTSDTRGAFMFRSGNGTGSINWQNVQLKWNYGTDGLASTSQVTVKVYAIEMVYIPQGKFFIGDGNITLNQSTNGFKLNNVGDNRPYEITSENAISFQNSSGSSTTVPYDPLRPNGVALSASYPKGYAAFYTMKYEISQLQYMEFFNTLPNNSTIKTNRNLGQNGGSRNQLYWDNQVLNGMVLVGGASGDRACNFMTWSDMCAYADWAGMRPMSELEYEKASRGCDVNGVAIFPVNQEYAWGNTSITNFSGMLSDNTANESTSNTSANAHYSGSGISGPLRNGIFASKSLGTDARRNSGGSYYGVLDLSGGLSEIVAQVYNIRTTSNLSNPLISTIHGNGALSVNGHADVANWCNINMSSSEVINYSSCSGPDYGSVRGGSWNDGTTLLRTSDRSQIGNGCSIYGNSRTSYIGGRLVRMP